MIPTDELYADIFNDEAQAAAALASATDGTTGEASGSDAADILAGGDADGSGSGGGDAEYTLVDMESQAVIARSNIAAIDADARQTLSAEEIESLKREGTGAGRDLIAKLLLSHAALDQKTAFSLAKYKLLKTKKYIRRFTVLPLDVGTLGNWLLDDRDVGSKIMELRDEMVALLGCWANAHYGGPDRFLEAPAQETSNPEAADTESPATEGDAGTLEASNAKGDQTQGMPPPPGHARDLAAQLGGSRWLVVDDTGGLLVAAMAERMGILYNPGEDQGADKEQAQEPPAEHRPDTGAAPADESMADPLSAAGGSAESSAAAKSESTVLESRPKRAPKRAARDDFHVAFSLANTLTLLHANNQANLTYLKYFGFDHADPNPPPHPLNDHLLCLSWLQLLEPESDTVYAQPPPVQPPDVVAAWKPARRGNYHRKRRRWARTRHIVDSARVGGFAGLVVATTMDLASTLRHALPLLASGAPVALYSPNLEPLTALADCFSVARRTAWSGPDPPAAVQGKTVEELERWPGDDEFPLNPMLLLGVTVQTSRARKWQVLPGRTHPLMTARGGAEGYIFTGWKAKPAEGRVTARGKFKKRKTA